MSEALIQRFEIEEVLSQTPELIRFRARDRESGNPVELIRFLPFGSGQEEGLSPKEQEAYLGSIGRLRSFEHPSLRKVVAGACDPVDGVPFMVVEPCDGETISENATPLPAPEAFNMLRAALEVSTALSEVLNHPGIWIDTDPASVLRVRGNFLFAIHPLRIIGAESPENACLATLAQSAMRWKGRMIGDQTGEGLGGWVKWVRSAGANVDPSEALERLLALRGGTGTSPQRPQPSASPAKARPPAAITSTGGTFPPLAASRPGLQTALRPPKKSAKAPLIIICSLALASGTIAWISSRKQKPADQAAAAPQTNAPLTEVDRIKRKAEELAALRKSQTTPLSTAEEWEEPGDTPPPTAQDGIPFQGKNVATLRKRADYGQKVAWEWEMVEARVRPSVANRSQKVLEIFCDSPDRKQHLQGLLRVLEQDGEQVKQAEVLAERINRDRPKVRILGTFLRPSPRGFVFIEAASIDDIQIVAP